MKDIIVGKTREGQGWLKATLLSAIILISVNAVAQKIEYVPRIYVDTYIPTAASAPKSDTLSVPANVKVIKVDGKYYEIRRNTELVEVKESSNNFIFQARPPENSLFLTGKTFGIAQN
jgi:hypothetical protein